MSIKSPKTDPGRLDELAAALDRWAAGQSWPTRPTSLEVFPIDGRRWFLVRCHREALPAPNLQPSTFNLQPPHSLANLFAKFVTPLVSSVPSVPSPEYALRKGLGCWDLWFEGEHAVVRHEQGILYVAWLLTHPAKAIHALDLAAKIPEIYRKQLGLAAIAESTAESAGPLASHARIQERSLALDDAQTMRALLRKEKELEAILEDDSETEPVKQEALRELEAIAQFQREHGRRTVDNAQRTFDTVRKAIKRFYYRIVLAQDRGGSPHPVFRPFAAHLRKHLLVPSTRYGGPRGKRARGPLAGCFIYEPPPGAVWAE
jgi:hypothetical protein